MTKKHAEAFLVVLLVSGCGGVTESKPQQPAGDARRACTGIPPPMSRYGPPAIPRPISPAGPAVSWRAEYWEADVTGAEGGLCVVSNTKRGTFAVTGTVLNGSAPLPRARVTLEALDSALALTLEAVTDRNGAFAFVNVPVDEERTCYRQTVKPPGGETWTELDWASPGEFVQTIELDSPRPEPGRSCIESS